MSAQEKRWDDLNIAILTRSIDDGQALKQVIVDETNADAEAFTKYEDIFAYCKERQDIGFLFLSEDCDPISFEKIFKELAKHYESQGLPCFGVILYNNGPSARSAGSTSFNKRLIAYKSISELTSRETSRIYFNLLWDQYIGAFKDYVMPPQLEITLRNLAESALNKDGLHFTGRLANHLQAYVSFKWLESIALQYSIILQSVHQLTPMALRGQQTLLYLLEITGGDNKEHRYQDLFQIAESNLPILFKITAIISHLEWNRKNGTLNQELDNLARTKISDPVLNGIQKNQNYIRTFAKEAVRADETI